MKAQITAGMGQDLDYLAYFEVASLVPMTMLPIPGHTRRCTGWRARSETAARRRLDATGTARKGKPVLILGVRSAAVCVKIRISHDIQNHVFGLRLGLRGDESWRLVHFQQAINL